MEEVVFQNLWTFELGTQKGIIAPIWIIVGFQQRNRQDSQKLNNDAFYRPPVTNAQCIIETEKYHDRASLLNYNHDGYHQGYGQTIEAFRVLTKYDVVQPYKRDNDFRPSNNGNDIDYNFYVFDIRYQKRLESAQSIEVQCNFSASISVGIYGYDLVLTKNLVSISSDGQRQFDSI